MSGMDQNKRDEIMESFRAEEFNVLISTNVLARGIDVPQVDIVVNFDVPIILDAGWKEPDYANYMHRVGRSGRFGTDGLSITFVTKGNEDEPIFVDKIAKEYKIDITELKNFDDFKRIYEKMRKPASAEEESKDGH